MQRCIGVAVAALLLLGGCGSAGPNPHTMSVDVIEVVSQSQRPADLGPRFFQIRIANKSQQTLMIHAIRVEAGTSDYEIDAPPEQVETAIASGDAQDFPIAVTVGRARAERGSFAMDSLRLTIDCTDESGADFLESGTYPIRRQASD
ncbi:MAG TPA: hypothetical protein VL284_01550 [Thermoanaerobaculia bacterium]|nr:hypothetical protein [Thermoanaerobaculia bacterium]